MTHKGDLMCHAIVLGVTVFSLISCCCGRYTSCTSGRYGPECDGVCHCADHEDCDDGPTGTGECECMIGYESQCGPDAPPSTSVTSQLPVCFHLSPLGLRVDENTHRQTRQVYNATVTPVRISSLPHLTTPLILDHATATLTQLSRHCTRMLSNDPHSSSGPSSPDPLSSFGCPEHRVGFAHCYGGHQFGSWAGQLGDGRALSLGLAQGMGGVLWEIGLKGSGRTPYSRAGDGRAVLGSLVREYLGAQFLTAMGVPCSMPLTVIGPDSLSIPNAHILRDEWYRGKLQPFPSGLLVRALPSFLRFGSLQLAVQRQPREGVVELLRHLLRTIAKLEVTTPPAVTHYLARSRLYRHDSADMILQDRKVAECFGLPFDPQDQRGAGDREDGGIQPALGCAAEWSVLSVGQLVACVLERLHNRTAVLIAAWQAVGFAHGVMNTDNMSAIGWTVDLNVFGFVEAYDVGYTPNYIDDAKRYAFGNQPEIAWWNIEKVADALQDLFVRDLTLLHKARGTKADFLDKVSSCQHVRLAYRLGLPSLYEASSLSIKSPTDPAGRTVVKGLLDWLAKSHADFHAVFQTLVLLADGSDTNEHSCVNSDADQKTCKETIPDDHTLERNLIADNIFRDWFANYQSLVTRWADPDEWRQHMLAVNPRAVFRAKPMRQLSEMFFANRNYEMARRTFHSASALMREPFRDTTIADNNIWGGDSAVIGGLFQAVTWENAGTTHPLQSSCGAQ